jgi:hypothetical protein
MQDKTASVRSSQALSDYYNPRSGLLELPEWPVGTAAMAQAEVKTAIIQRSGSESFFPMEISCMFSSARSTFKSFWFHWLIFLDSRSDLFQCTFISVNTGTIYA